MPGKRDGAVGAAGQVLTLQHPPLSHLGTEGRRAGSGARALFGGYFKRCEDSFLRGMRGTHCVCPSL